MYRMYLRRIIQQTTSSMERTDEGESLRYDGPES